MTSLQISQTKLKRTLLALFVLSLIAIVLFTATFTSTEIPFHLKWISVGHDRGGKLVSDASSTSPETSKTPFVDDARHANETLLKLAPSYVKAILDPTDATFPRLACTTPTHNRYAYLQGNTTRPEDPRPKRRYFFALDLHQCVHLLPRLIGSIVEAIRFLGPENCALSIIEGRSRDGTYEVLFSARQAIEELGVQYFFQSSDLNPKVTERIATLAKLRNLALEPLVKNPDQYDPQATVIFLNDIALCMEDILEMIHQRVYQEADMTCAMDWTYVGPDPTFYDIWIARTMTGETFFEIPPDGNWNSAWNLFWNSPIARDRYNARKPFQVFSCWNGITAFTAKPLLEQNLKFRSASKKECFQGEPRLWCKDMWHLGYGRIAVIPTVNVEYSDEAATKIKALKGYVSASVPDDGTIDPAEKIDWLADPPATVKCITDPNYANQHHVPWDQGLSRF